MSTDRKPTALPGMPGDATADALNRKLPRGSSRLPREVAQESQRVRLIFGLAASIVEKGYAATTLTDITRHAGVSRATFYEIFSDKEHCYLEGFRTMARIHMQAALDAAETAEHHADKCRAALGAYVERIDAHRPLALAFIAEAEAASPPIRKALEDVQGEWMELLRAWLALVRADHPEVPPAAEHTLAMLVCGLRHFAYLRARADARARVQDEGVPELARFVFGALGLYGWARQVGTAGGQWGAPAH